MYYYGRIKAIQLEYTEALDYLVKSLRKAPSSAVGFRQTVEKLRVTVELLLGNIPERQLFLQQANKEALAPYFELTKGIYEVLYYHGGLLDNDCSYSQVYYNSSKYMHFQL